MSPFEWSVMTLWEKGWDTFDIAAELKVAEAEVANLLLHLRERKRNEKRSDVTMLQKVSNGLD